MKPSTIHSYSTAAIIGAENHQPVCLANETSANEEKSEEKCDRDEGDGVARFEAAAQASWNGYHFGTSRAAWAS